MLPPLEPAQAREAAALPALPQRRVTEAFLHAISGLLDRSDALMFTGATTYFYVSFFH